MLKNTFFLSKACFIYILNKFNTTTWKSGSDSSGKIMYTVIKSMCKFDIN